MHANNRRLITAALLLTATAAAAQGRGGPCTLGTELSYGISALDCLQCTVRSDGTDRWTEYGAEPVVRGVMRTMNPIQQGDVIVAIDGKLITTSAGGRALSHPEAGRAARFMIRRGGRTTEINVMPGTPCPIVSPATAAAMAASGAIADTMSQALKDRLRDAWQWSTTRWSDTVELRYERDAFGRPYHFRFADGDSVSFNTIVSGQMLFQPEGRLVFMTDSVGRRRFAEVNPAHPIRRQLHWQFGKSLGSFDTIPSGALDASFTLPIGSRVIGFQLGTFGFRDLYTYIPTPPDGIGGFQGTEEAGTTRRNTARGTAQDSADVTHTDMNVTTTRGWLGIALDCLRCSVDREDRSSRDHAVRFTTPPKVVAVEPGAAAVAGFKPGDVIRTIDGNAMTSAAGARRFSTMRGGERVRFVVERGKQLLPLTLVVPH